MRCLHVQIKYRSRHPFTLKYGHNCALQFNILGRLVRETQHCGTEVNSIETGPGWDRLLLTLCEGLSISQFVSMIYYLLFIQPS